MIDRTKIKSYILADLPKSRSFDPEGAKWVDAVSQLRQHGARAALNQGTWNGYIYRRFGHLAVNPSRASSRKALLASYVFTPQNIPSGIQVANRDEESALAFVQSLIVLAKEQRELWENRSPDSVEYRLAQENLSLLIGPRGCGKTFFLNYLLSKHHELLNEERVVWVRVDLTQLFFLRPQDQESVPLEDWAHAQATKILYRYYDASSIHSKDKPIKLNIDLVLQHYIESAARSKEEREVLEEKRRKLAELFPIGRHRYNKQGVGSAEAPLSQSLVPSDIGLHIVNYALKAGYSFIVIFDGLDVIDSGTGEHKKFLKYSAAVQRLAKDHGKLGMTFVSAERMYEGRQQYKSQYDIAPSREYGVFPVDIQSIVEQRIKFIMSEARYIRTRPEYPKELKLKSHLNAFRNYIAMAEEGGKTTAQFMSLLTEALGPNRRAQMQVTQLLYADFIIGTKTKPYKLIEALVTEDGWVPPRRFDYAVGESGWLIPRRVGDRRFDNRFLPAIYTFPLNSEEVIQDVTMQHEYIMANLRILQLALAPRQLSREKVGGIYPDLSVHEVGDVLKSLFGYDQRIVYGMIQELSEYEMIWLTGYSRDAPASVERACIRPLPKAEWLLEFATNDVAYLNLAAMRCPYRSSQDQQRQRSFRALPLPIDGKPDDVRQWIVCKIENALRMIRVILTYDRHQRASVDAWVESEGKKMKNRLVLYVKRGITPVDRGHVADHICNQVERIMDEMRSRSGEEVAEQTCRAIEGFMEYSR